MVEVAFYDFDCFCFDFVVSIFVLNQYPWCAGACVLAGSAPSDGRSRATPDENGTSGSSG